MRCDASLFPAEAADWVEAPRSGRPRRRVAASCDAVLRVLVLAVLCVAGFAAPRVVAGFAAPRVVAGFVAPRVVAGFVALRVVAGFVAGFVAPRVVADLALLRVVAGFAALRVVVDLAALRVGEDLAALRVLASVVLPATSLRGADARFEAVLVAAAREPLAAAGRPVGRVLLLAPDFAAPDAIFADAPRVDLVAAERVDLAPEWAPE